MSTNATPLKIYAQLCGFQLLVFNLNYWKENAFLGNNVCTDTGSLPLYFNISIYFNFESKTSISIGSDDNLLICEFVSLQGMHILCKCAYIMQVCNYASVQLCQCATMPVCNYASVQLCQCATMPSVQLCKCATMQVCNYASVQLCKCATMQVCY